MTLEYTIQRTDEYQPLPHHRHYYTPEERERGRYIVWSNDGDSALCKSMDEVQEWIVHNWYSRGFDDDEGDAG